jgi:hypothetical protein
MTFADFVAVAEDARSRLQISPPAPPDLWLGDWLMQQPGLVAREGTWCEFGVYEGGSLKQLAAYRGNAQLWGFDSFRGLPEEWNAEHPKGRFAMERPIMPPDGVNLVVGQIEDTLQSFEPTLPSFLHIDTDLYEPAAAILKWYQRWLISEWPSVPYQTVILFDDIGIPPYENGEMRALYEAQERGLKFEWIAWEKYKAAIQVM